MRSGCSAADFEDKCASLGLQDLAVEAMSRLWKRRAVQVATSLMSRALTNNQLVDMDWTFGVTSASDDCDHVGKTYLQLKLTLSHGPPVLLELTLDQFYQFLASMEKCKSYLDFVVPAAS
ncbi:HCaRG protein-domain-containing protein [Ochromonadaceae sp. CCMP2298]|nr:HCaRG protein-domain-containing protein [Ochromonadaceae sp. CCMP2298]